MTRPELETVLPNIHRQWLAAYDAGNRRKMLRLDKKLGAAKAALRRCGT